MYIRELHVDGYGALHDVRLVFDRPLAVVFGPNEAGKSTLLRFIRSMLYGIAPRSQMVDRGEPVHGGRHGGRMIVQAADGQQWQLERYAAGAAGRRTTGSGFSIRDASGTRIDWTQAEWERRALGGISERLFRQLFAITLDELHELLTLQGEEVGNYLYHTGLAGGASLSIARRKLSGEMDKLFRPRGHNQALNALLSERKELAALIRQRHGALDHYRQTMQQWEESRFQLQTLQESLPKLAAHAAFLHDVLQLREWWLKRQALMAEDEQLRSSLSDPACEVLAAHVASDWSNLVAGRAAAEKQHREAQSVVRERQRQRQALQWDDDLLAREAELDKLAAMRDMAAARAEERESLISEQQLTQEAIDTLRLRLSSDWTQADLQQFANVLPEREPLKRLQQAWAEENKTAERLRAESGRIRRQLEALQDEPQQDQVALPHHHADDAHEHQGEQSRPKTGLRDAEHAFGPLRTQRREALLTLWNALEDEVRRWERLQAERRLRAAELSRTTTYRNAGISGFRLAASVTLGLLAFGSLLAAGLTFGNSGQLAALLLAAAVACGAGAYILGVTARRAHAPIIRPESQDQATVKLESSRTRVETLLAQLLERPGHWADQMLGQQTHAQPDVSAMLATGINEQLWSELRMAVQQQLAKMEQAERERDRMEEYKRSVDALQREAAALQLELRESDQRQQAISGEWTSWLTKHRLPASLLPDSIPELLQYAEQGQNLLRRHSSLQARLAALEQEQQRFHEAAAPLLDHFPPPPQLSSDPALAIAWLRRQAAEHRAIHTEAQQQDRLLQEAQAALEQANAALEQVTAAMIRIVTEAGEPSEQSFEHRLHIDERRRAIASELREMALRLEAGKTPEAVHDLYRLFEQHDEAELSIMLSEAEDERQAAEDQLAQWLDKRGRLAQELDRLRREAETQDHLQQAAELDDNLQRLTKRYAVLALCDKLLEQTKTVFEQERQPEVLRLASAYFEQITEGAYIHVQVQQDPVAVIAQSRDGRYVESSFLSRGTQEQLYLSMRFALASAASQQSPLPLLLDDLFVHFDERRLTATVPVLEKIARERQIILFTCHQHVVSAVKQQVPDSAIMSWEARRPAARRGETSGLG